MQHDLIGLAPPTIDDILAQAPDPVTWRAALELAGKPCVFGRAPGLVWGEFSDGRRVPIHSLHTDDYRAGCSCSNARFPCRHILALRLRAAANPNDALGYPPDWLPGRLGALSPASLLAPEEDARRLAALRAGLVDLERWLADMIHWGLAALPAKGPRYWTEAADRLADAYGPEIALDVRDLPSVTVGGRDWPEQLLPRLGRLQLLAEGFRRYDDLPPAMQGDLRAAAGLTPLEAHDAVEDRWLVLGRQAETIHRQRRRRTWLYGLGSGRHALLAETGGEREMTGTALPVGAVVGATADFHASAWPLAAELRPGLTPGGQADVAGTPTTIAVGLGTAAAALAANPWLRRFPLVLGGVRLEPRDGGWRLRDRAGALLPLPAGYDRGWHLLAVAADRPMTLFGEWDGWSLTPLSIDLAAGGSPGRWVSLDRWKGIP